MVKSIFDKAEIEQADKDICQLLEILYYWQYGHTDYFKPQDDPELAGLYLLRKDDSFLELIRKFPTQFEILKFLEERHKRKGTCPHGVTIGDALQGKSTIEIDSELRVSKDLKIWGMAYDYCQKRVKGYSIKDDLTCTIECEKLMTGDIIPNFQQFLYKRFKMFLNVNSKGITNPFRKIVNASYLDGITNQYQKVRLSDLWDARAFIQMNDFEILPLEEIIKFENGIPDTEKTGKKVNRDNKNRQPILESDLSNKGYLKTAADDARKEIRNKKGTAVTKDSLHRGIREGRPGYGIYCQIKSIKGTILKNYVGKKKFPGYS